MRKFKTESKKLLDLMINSIYTNREIFLRELISNASDAVDKLYFRSLTDPSVAVGRDDLAITVGFSADERTVTVSDNGIGMTKDELDKNLGTIAHSDSFEFKAAQAEAAADSEPGEAKGLDDLTDVDIIGQFGVGFYSAFMVGKKVRVVSRAIGSDETWAWESDGVDGYDIKPAERAEHGTDVIVYLKDDTADESFGTFASEHGLTQLIKRYSNYVRYPIKMEVTKSRKVEAPEPAEGEEPAAPQWESYTEVETINSMIPIWKRKKSEVSQEEYDEFYKTDFHDFENPARTISVHAEGSLNYDALMFVPSRAPWDMYSKDYKRGLALYSSNVLIMDKCEELLPDYFGFVRGVVDSSDLTLNISRAAAQRPAARHRPPAREEDQGRSGEHARRRPRSLREVLRAVRPHVEVRYLPELRDGQGHARRPASVLLRQAAEDDHSGRVFGRGSRWRRFHLLCRGRFAGAFGRHAARDHGFGQGLRRAAVRPGRGRVLHDGHRHLR